jgi:hypothetical protein
LQIDIRRVEALIVWPQREGVSGHQERGDDRQKGAHRGTSPKTSAIADAATSKMGNGSSNESPLQKSSKGKTAMGEANRRRIRDLWSRTTSARPRWFTRRRSTHAIQTSEIRRSSARAHFICGVRSSSD